MQVSSFTNRFLVPLLRALTVMIASRVMYLNAHLIDSQALYHSVAVLAGTVQFASVLLVALLVYPVTYFRGATAAERVIASSTNLAVWVGIDAYNVSEAFPCMESIYYGVNIGSILFAWSFAWIGVLEVVCRWVSKRKGSKVRILTPLPFIPVVVFVLVVLVLSKDGGAAYFNMLLDGYVVLFRD